MRTYDISLTIFPNLPVWPGDSPPQFKHLKRLEQGADANVSEITINVHSGTHVDAPAHFLPKGKTVDQLLLKALTGRAFVLHLPNVDLITAKILSETFIPPRTRRILFKTRNSEYWAKQDFTFHSDYVALSPDGAEFLVNRGIKLVGIDYLSISPYGDTVQTHRILLESGVVIVEGLDLSQISGGRYTLFCLPLKLAGLEASPARAILIGV